MKRFLLLFFSLSSLFFIISYETSGDLKPPISTKKEVSSKKSSSSGNYSLKFLIKAVKKSDTAKVIEQTDHGVDINERSAKGNTPLMWAVYYGDIDIVTYLISKGADINATDKYRDEPLLMWGVKKGRLNITKLLISKGANVNLSDKYGETALMDSARYGYYEIAALLIKNSASVTAKSENGDTALILAASAGDRKIVELLVSEGADINAVNFEDGKSSLAKASEKGYDDIVKFLETKAVKEGAPMKRDEKLSDNQYTSKIPSMKTVSKSWKKAPYKLKKTLQIEEINIQMMSYISGIKQCYGRRVDAGDIHLTGTMNMEIHLAGSGEVLDVLLQDDRYISSYFGDCIVSVIKNQNFNMFKSQTMSFTYFYTF